MVMQVAVKPLARLLWAMAWQSFLCTGDAGCGEVPPQPLPQVVWPIRLFFATSKIGLAKHYNNPLSQAISPPSLRRRHASRN